ncbi:MAG: excinuclease ABC subunit UvrC [Terrimicrobiaceae bacterium]
MSSVPRADFQAILRDMPHKPGVYVMRDRLNHVIYVGKARDLRKRVGSYFMPSRKFAADLKTRALIDSVWGLEYHVVRSDAEAVLFEGRLIKEFRPKYNVSFRDDKRFLMVRVHLDEPFPRFALTRLRRDDGARYFGPFPNSGALRSTLNAVRKQFGIRSCRPPEPGEKDFKHCLDHIIKNCSAPCVAKVSREEYVQRVRDACDFMDGQSREMIHQVEAEMKAAAEKMDFEKAAQLRNLLEDLKTTTKPVARFTRRSLPTTIHPEADLAALRDALGLETLPRVMECFDISNISSTHIVASMVRFRDGVPDRTNYRKYRIVGTPNQNDFASMAEVVRRRYGRVLREAATGRDMEFNQEPVGEAAQRIAEDTQTTVLPDLIIVDGGRGQLSSACKELQRLGLHHVAIIGLAKEFEEIYRPGRPIPTRLPEDSGALRLLQRIRDEAHRTANGYHSLLLKKRVRESFLDGIPGVSAARKTALLEKFGSVERIRNSSPEDLSAVSGVSLKLARQVLESLGS